MVDSRLFDCIFMIVLRFLFLSSFGARVNGWLSESGINNRKLSVFCCNPTEPAVTKILTVIVAKYWYVVIVAKYLFLLSQNTHHWSSYSQNTDRHFHKILIVIFAKYWSSLSQNTDRHCRKILITIVTKYWFRKILIIIVAKYWSS